MHYVEQNNLYDSSLIIYFYIPEFLCLCRESASRKAWSTACSSSSSSSSSSPASSFGDGLVNSGDVSFFAEGQPVADLRRENKEIY